MIEDRLEPAQRIRLEALNQAVQVTLSGSMGGLVGAMMAGETPAPSSAEVVLETARRFERWIAGGDAVDDDGGGFLTTVAIGVLAVSAGAVQRVEIASAVVPVGSTYLLDVTSEQGIGIEVRGVQPRG